MKLPPAKAIAATWRVSVDTVYGRTHGRTNTPAVDIDTLAREHDLDVAELVSFFAARRRRYLERGEG